MPNELINSKIHATRKSVVFIIPILISDSYKLIQRYPNNSKDPVYPNVHSAYF